MPGTTRYSATFDRTYEEEAKASSPPNARRSRSQSWQANSGHDGRQYTPFASRSPAPRSSSTDNNLGNGTEFIPTRTAKTSVKAHNNPFQFVKVGTCPLYKKAEEQLKKAKETKKPDVLKEEEEEWQTNLDSWKSRRRKMSEDVFRRQEELKLLELEEQIAQVSNKKTKTFSEMVESRATRGRALSLCLLTSPLEFQNWEFENKAHKSGSCSYTDESGENSIVNSEDEGVSVRGRHEEISISENAMNHRTNGDAHIEQNGTALDKQNGNCNKLSNNVQMKTKENSYIDSGLESISSSHRAGDTPDSGSDFSQDSNSSIDCDSPRTGVNVLEEFSSKSSQISEGHEIRIILKLDEKGQDFGFTFLGGKDEGQVIIASILEGSKAESSGMHLGDRIITIDGCDVSSKKHIEIAALIQKGREKNQMNLLLWRHTKTTNGTNGFIAEAKDNKVITDENFNAKSYEKSIESENEMFVDDFEELKRQSDLLANKKSVAANALANGNKLSNKDAICLKTSSESSTAPIPKINTSNSAVEEPDKNEEKAEINNENQKKNIIKVKRVRRKGVYALNVDSNQISQDGNCTNTLFPLSPVTELPSPADESKTMSSTLSSNITLPVSNSQNGLFDEGKQKNAESIKPNIPVSKENNSGIPTSGNTDNSKSATLQTDSKNVENQIQLNTENKTEIANSSTLSSKSKDSQDEKSKSQPTIKKIKPSKLKKGMSSENTTAASECTKELTNAAQRGDVTSNTAIQEKSSSESNSSHSLENKQLATKNDVKNLATSEAMENNISSKNIPVKPATEIVSVPTKKPSNAVSNGIAVQSQKVVANNVKAPTTNIRPKSLTSENTSAASECTKELTNAAQCDGVTTKTAIQEKSSSESNSSHSSKNKQLATKNDVKNLATLETLGNNISSKNAKVKPATEIVSVPTKTPSNAVSNGIGVQSPKVVANNVKAPTTSIRPKILKSENTSAASECTKELTNAAQLGDATTKTAIQEKSSSESNSSHSFKNKQLATKNDVKNLATLETLENNTSSKNVPVKPATEIVSVPAKTPSNAVSNGIGVQSPKVVANNVKAPTTSIQPKMLTSKNTSAASECTKELTNAAQCDGVTTKTAIQEKSSLESNSSHSFENKQLATKNDVKNLATLETLENNTSSKNIPVKPATEIVSVPTKTPSNAVSNGIGVQSPKVVAYNVKAPTTSIQPKMLTSKNTSAASECTKELTNAAQFDGVTTKTAIQEKSSSESKSSHSLENKQLAIKNDVKNLATLQTMENNISSKNTPVKPATEISVPTKTPSNAVSNGIGVQSLKVVTNTNVKVPTTSVQPKILTSEDSKPKKNIQKKVILKSKANTTEKTSCGTSANSALNEIYSTKEQNSSIVQKQEKMDSKKEIAVSPLKEESNISLNGIANVSQEMKLSPKDETSIPCPSTNKVRDLTLKFGVKKPSVSSESSSPTKNAKAFKSPLNEKTKPEVVEKKESTKAKENCVEQNLISSPVALSSVSNSFDSSSKIMTVPNKNKPIKIAIKDEIVVDSSKMGNSDVQAPIGNKQVTNKSTTSSVSNASDLPSSKNPVKESQLKKEKKSTSLSQDEQIKTVVKNDVKVSPLTREKGMLLLEIGVNDATAVDKQSHKLPSPVVPANNPTSIVTPVNKSESDIVSPEISVAKNSIPKSPVNSADEKPKLPIPKRSRNRSKKKSANSQKVNTPAKLNEESKISNDSLNVVFQSQPKNMGSENITNNKNFENNNSRTAISTDLVTDVPPVDKIAEEMEKLILEQLEEEERAKELSTGKVLVESSPEHLLTAPPRLAEPPKEKPPPPPSTESPKDSSLKRVNSTKRIKKEIHKRRSNFLGIENADESICSESSVPPPPALEEILKAEMELDRQSRLRIENESTERLTLEEKEIMQKEREIIESLESEERRKMYLNGTEECNNVYMSSSTSDAVCEQGHIESLKSERKRIDTELQLSEEQQQILIEEKQLKEREEFIRQQEASISTVPLSDSSLSVSANTANNLKKPALSSVPTEVQSNGLLLGTNGDGSGLALSSSTEVSMNETSKGGKKIKASEKPAVPPKPLKKKEAIRKERERLRQEQEALQREREEHRRKLMLEQEELMKQQKTHAPDAPASRLGPHPPQIQPSFPPQLTTTMNATPNARENASFPSRSHHGTSNTAAGSLNTVELMGPPVVRQNIRPAPRKAAQNEAWGQQKMPSVRKQNHESLPESRYNQNHWLIQEAEMRRIAELKERQRTTQTPCTQTHLAEDDVCSNPPRVPVISPTHNPHLNYPVQEKVWNYGQSNMPLKKYPPPVVKEPPLHTIYPRETVPQQPPTKPSRVVPSERQEQMLSVSGRKRCSHCNEELGRGAAMIIESLQLYYHIHCFQCCVCQAQLGNGSCGTDVRVRNNKLHCHNCYSNDEAGLKFSQV